MLASPDDERSLTEHEDNAEEAREAVQDVSSPQLEERQTANNSARGLVQEATTCVQPAAATQAHHKEFRQLKLATPQAASVTPAYPQ
eukprot:383451-Hanusia_phi.AAC.1